MPTRDVRSEEDINTTPIHHQPPAIIPSNPKNNKLTNTQTRMVQTITLVLTSVLIFFATTGLSEDGSFSELLPTSPEYSFDGHIIHYPVVDTQFSNIVKVFDPSYGTNGGIYNSSYVSDEFYGIYNFCNEPHVRKDIYEVVSDDYKLEYVEVVHRHHKRTVYASNTFPKENIDAYCNNSTMNYGTSFENENNSLNLHWNPYLDEFNPFSKDAPYDNTTCQLPQLTDAGLEDAYQHGKDLFEVYSELVNFLPANYSPEAVRFRVTNNVITSQVGSALIKAMYPSESAINASIELDGFDSLEPSYDCEFADDVFKDIKSSDEWNDHLARAESLYHELDSISGVDPDDDDWHVSFDHYFDNLAFRLCHGYDLPCNITNPDNCVTIDQAEQVFRLGDWEYNYMWRVNANTTLHAATHYGAYFNELKHRLLSKTTMSKELKYFHNIAHDGSVSSILSFLNVDYMRWPGMGSEVVFELYSRNGQFFIRVLHSSRVINTTSPLGALNLVPLNDFLNYIEEMIGTDAERLVSYCSN